MKHEKIIISLFRFDSNYKTIKIKIQKMVVQLSPKWGNRRHLAILALFGQRTRRKRN